MISKIRAILIMLQMFITVSILIIIIAIKRENNKPLRQLWSKLQLKLLGINLKIEGNLDYDSQMMLINHQSLLDIIVLEAIDSRDIAWVAKKEIGDIPWFGLILKLPKMIAIQRESKKSLIQLLKDVKIVLDENRPVAIFPEGTRGDGRKLRKFKSGAKLVANKYNLKVQPIVLIGTREILDSQKLTQKSGEVKVIFLDSVQANSSTTWYEDTEKAINEQFYKNIKG